MPKIRTAQELARFGFGMLAFLGRRTTPARDRQAIQAMLRRRTEAFLALMAGAVYAVPQSPYRRLLQAAGCEFADLQRLVVTQELEEALQTLQRAGVYLTTRELRSGVVDRPGLAFEFTPEDVENPMSIPHFRSASGGSTGQPRTAGVSFQAMADWLPHTGFMLHVHGLRNAEMAIYQPGKIALQNLLTLPALGSPPARWFSIVPLSDRQHGLSGPMLRLLGLSRLRGVRLPAPEFVPVDNPLPVAQWIAAGARGRRARMVFTYPSAALAICRVAAEAGLDLRAGAFSLTGEAVTPARREIFRQAGVKIVPRFAMSEVGHVASACPASSSRDAPDDMHVWQDLCALISYRRPVAGGLYEVDGLLFTTLLLSTSKVWLNTESDDFGTLRTCDCGCEFDQLGLRQHLSHVSSFGKFTSDVWAQVINPRILPLLEETLPRRFGAQTGQFQLVEEPLQDGQRRLMLLIDPKVGDVDPQQVEAFFKAQLAAGLGTPDASGALPRIEVRRAVPIGTPGGKVMPYYQVSMWRQAPAARA